MLNPNFAINITNTSTQITRPTQLPDEIIVQILHCCHYRTIIQFSMTCRSFHGLVCQSASLQLHIELDISGLEIVSQPPKVGGSYPSILEELKAYWHAWQYFKFDPVICRRTFDQGIFHPAWDLRNGVYIGALSAPGEENQAGRFNRLQIHDLHSPVISPPLDCKKIFNEFEVDINQNLAVLVEYDEERSHSFFAQIDLIHTTTGLPHPLAQRPTFTIQFGDTRSSIKDVKTWTMDNVLVLKFSGPYGIPNSCGILFWDWKLGATLGKIDAMANGTYLSFLDKRHAFVYSPLPNSDIKLEEVALIVYRIPTPTDSAPTPSNLEFFEPSIPNINPVLILEFPKIHSAYQLRRYFLLNSRIVGDTLYRRSAEIACSHTTTIGLTLCIIPRVEDGQNIRPIDDIKYSIFVNTDCIFRYLSQNKTEDTAWISWSQWGTEATRWFIDGDSLASRAMASYGSLYPLWAVDRDSSKQVLSIFEFNPRIVKRCLYQLVRKDQIEIFKGQDIVSDLTFTGTDLKNPMESADKAEMNQDIVTEIVDHKTKINVGFEGPIESSLPYMVVTRVQRFPVHRDWYMEGDYLVGALPDIQDGPHHPLSLYKLQISRDH